MILTVVSVQKIRKLRHILFVYGQFRISPTPTNYHITIPTCRYNSTNVVATDSTDQYNFRSSFRNSVRANGYYKHPLPLDWLDSQNIYKDASCHVKWYGTLESARLVLLCFDNMHIWLVNKTNLIGVVRGGFSPILGGFSLKIVSDLMIVAQMCFVESVYCMSLLYDWGGLKHDCYRYCLNRNQLCALTWLIFLLLRVWLS